MKKIIVGSIIVIILIIASVAAYFYLNPWETISENGFSFSYPKKNATQIYQLLNTDESTYRIDIDNSMGRIHIRTTQIHLDSQYPTAPVILQYFRTDADTSLDQVWELIQKTLKY